MKRIPGLSLLMGILLVIVAKKCETLNIYRNSTQIFNALAVTSDYVFIGGSKSLIQLNSSLDVLRLTPVDGPHWLLSSSFNTSTLHSCIRKEDSTTNCTIYRNSDLLNLEYKPGIKLGSVDVRYAATTIGSEKIFAIAASKWLIIPSTPNKFRAITIIKSQFTEYNPQNSYVEYKSEDETSFKFKSVLPKQQYIYFLFVYKDTFSKLGKLCTKNILESQLTPYEDMPIYCVHNRKNYTLVQDAIWWNDDLIVSFSDSSTSVICKYSNLSEHFKKSRKDRLVCPFNKTNHIFKVKSTVFCYNSTLLQCSANSQPVNGVLQPECKAEAEGDFCKSKYFGIIDGKLSLLSDEVLYSQNLTVGFVTKLKEVIVHDKYIVIYIGTSYGYLGKIFINMIKETDAFLVEDFKLVEKFFPIIDIQIENGNVYAMTENTLVKESKDCENTDNCETCMKSMDPRCGWDLQLKTCNKQHEKILWIPSAGKQCLKIETNGIPQGEKATTQETVRFKLVPDYLPPSDILFYKKTASDRSEAIAKKENSYYEVIMNVPQNDTKVLLNLTDEEEKFSVVNFEVPIYRCGAAENCISCVKDRKCFWCPLDSKCVLAANTCTHMQSVNEMEEDKCPSIDSEIVVISNDKKENLTLNVSNFEPYEDQQSYLKCNINNKLFGATLISISRLRCENVTVSGKSSSRIDVKYNERTVDATNLEVYKCSDFGDCGECRYKKEQGYRCQWCGSCKDEDFSGNCNKEKNCKIVIKSVSPSSGPEYGGTKITITGKFNLGTSNPEIAIKLYGVECHNATCLLPYTSKGNNQKLQCITGNFSKKSDDRIQISVHNTEPFEGPADLFYTYKHDQHITLRNCSPSNSILAGGRLITVVGDNLGFTGGNHYRIRFCNATEDDCVECRNVKVRNRDTVRCKIGEHRGKKTLQKLLVDIDGNTQLSLNKAFKIVDNPTISQDETGDVHVFKSGGRNMVFKGQGFEYVSQCFVSNGLIEFFPCQCKSTEVTCPAPPFLRSSFERRKRSIGQNVFISFDNWNVRTTVYYFEDPEIYPLPDTIVYEADGTSDIIIKGNNLLDAARQSDYIVHIGLTGQCLITDMGDENITCTPPDTVPATNNSDENTVFIHVQVGFIRQHVGYLRYEKEFPLITVLVAALSGVCAAAVIIIIVVMVLSRHRAKKATEHFHMELLSREERIREASREEFADAQMTIRDIKSDLVTSKVPFFDYQAYSFHHLFPNQDMETHPLLHQPVITDDKRRKVQKAMDMLDKLMTNKLFLKSLIQTLDCQKRITLHDKANFASLITVAVLGNMRLFYQLIDCLISHMIMSTNKKQYKVLFRRFESITQRLVVHWLAMSLYDHLKRQSGMQLFMLYKATQTVIEKAPIDAVTKNSRNTLAEERLLKQRVEFETLTLNIDLNGNSVEKIPVVVLDCDTITQVKQKCVTAIYKNKPASEVPNTDDLELEWHQGRGGKHILHDIDNISDRSNGMIRLNTLKHYCVKDKKEMALFYKELMPDRDELYANTASLEINSDEAIDDTDANQAMIANPENVKLWIPDGSSDHDSNAPLWHLSNLTDEEKSNNENAIGELYLNRLFHTKLILRDYIDAAFEGITDPQNLPVPIRYFLCMLDKRGKDVGVDADVLQNWKSECYATRVWSSLISNPQILFDVAVPSHVEPCMDILRQVFIDSFTQESQSISKDSSTQKLLFFKDVPEYRKRVNSFFLRVEPVSDQDFWRAMDEISQAQTREMKFNRQATLHKLFDFISKYKDEIIEDFDEKEETKDLEFGIKLEEIINTMEED